jgi:ribonuclease HI
MAYCSAEKTQSIESHCVYLVTDSKYSVSSISITEHRISKNSAINLFYNERQAYDITASLCFHASDFSPLTFEPDDRLS